MAKPQPTQNWPYRPQMNLYQSQHHPYLPYGHTRMCQGSCCRPTRVPTPYHHSIPDHHAIPYPTHTLQYSNEESSFMRQSTPQVSSYVPVSPYMAPQSTNNQQMSSVLHRPIPHNRYDYRDCYRFNSNQQMTILKQSGTSNNYSTSQITSSHSHYSSRSQFSNSSKESSNLPNIDVRQFLATWQEKDDDIAETPAQSTPSYQVTGTSRDGFQPLDCTKRTETVDRNYGYPQETAHSYFNKTIQNTAPASVRQELNYVQQTYFNAVDVSDLSHPNHINLEAVNAEPHNYERNLQFLPCERKIEKICNPSLGCKAPYVASSPKILPDGRCPVDINNCRNMNPKDFKPALDKSQYTLTASLENDDLFDDINRRKEEKQKNVVHPLRYTGENFTPRVNMNMKKNDVPQVTVKPNTQNLVESDCMIPPSNCVTPMEKPHYYKTQNHLERGTSESDQPKKMYNMTDNFDYSTKEPFSQDNNATASFSFDGSVELKSNYPSCENQSLIREEPELVGTSEISSELIGPDFICPNEDDLPCETEKFTNNSLDKNMAVGECQDTEISSDDIDITIVSSDCVIEDNEKSADVSRNENSDGILASGNDQLCDSLSKRNDSSKEMDSQNKSEEELLLPETNTTDLNVSPVSQNKDLASHHLSSTNALLSIAFEYDDQNVSENSMDSVLTSSNRNRDHNCSINKINRLKNDKPGIHRKLKRKWKSVRRISLLRNWKARNGLPLLKIPKRHPKKISKQCLGSKVLLSSNQVHQFQFSIDSNENSTTNNKDSMVSKSLLSPINFSSLEPRFQNDSSESLNVFSYKGILIDDNSSQENESPFDDNQNSLPIGTHHRSTKKCSNKDGIKCIFQISKSSPVPSMSSSQNRLENVASDNQNDTKRSEDNENILQGIVNWPQHEEDILCTNEKESIKCSLPWVKIFKKHQELSGSNDSLELGPAKVELRLASTPQELRSGHWKVIESNKDSPSSIVNVKRLILRRRSSEERVPKMVIKKTDGQEYQSFLKDGMVESNPAPNHQPETVHSIKLNAIDDSNNNYEDPVTSKEFETALQSEIKQLHHCLLCHASFSCFDDLKIHEATISHRHLDLIQRNAVHKLFNIVNGCNYPSYKPLDNEENSFLNWKPDYIGYQHHYHNAPM